MKSKVDLSIEKIKISGISGDQLFNNQNWLRVNRLMMFFLSDEETVMFTLISEVENLWKTRKKQIFVKNNGYFLFTIDYVKKSLNKNPDQQRRPINKLSTLGLITIKYKIGKQRFIKINWQNFTELYLEWLKQKEEIEKNWDKDNFEQMSEESVENKYSIPDYENFEFNEP